MAQKLTRSPSCYHSGGESRFIAPRPFIYAAEEAGEAGITYAAEILTTEVRRNMGLLGLDPLSELEADRLLRVGRSRS